jgi:hypothetical protein
MFAQGPIDRKWPDGGFGAGGRMTGLHRSL